MKKSFLLHHDSLDVLDVITDAQCGKLLKKMRSYHNGNEYVSDDPLVDAVFIQFKNQFDRDIENRHKVKEARSKAGALGGRPKKQIKQMVSGESKGKQSKAKKAVKVNVNVKGNVKVNVNGNVNKEIKTLSNDKETKVYGNPEVNECLEIIKGLNGGIVDGTIKDQRRYAKHLIDKIKKLDKISSGERLREDYLKGLLNLVSKSKYDVRKIVGPKQIFKNLAGLQQVANAMHTEMKNPKKNLSVSKIKL